MVLLVRYLKCISNVCLYKCYQSVLFNSDKILFLSNKIIGFEFNFLKITELNLHAFLTPFYEMILQNAQTKWQNVKFCFIP